MTNKPILLSDYKNKQIAELAIDDETRKKAVSTQYSKFYHLILRQLGREGYTEEIYDNPRGEELFCEMLGPELRANLERILVELEPIAKKIERELNKK